MDTEGTIVGISTPPGRGALGIVRVSGKKTRDLLDRLFVPRGSGSILPFRPTVGRIALDAERYIDEVLATFFQSPHSYTREDLAEISCHGNPWILENVVRQVVSLGGRLARPGEFTYRAFLNGRIDLVQAEAVQDLILSDCLAQAEVALRQLDGRLSQRFEQLQKRLLELVSLMEGNIDFSEEEHYSFVTGDQILAQLTSIGKEIQSLIGTFEKGRLIREGMRVSLVGRPNAGKSSVFNKLLGSDRAIVTAVPGTTRDYLEERIVCGNVVIHLLDTAGIRKSMEEVELEGIRRSRDVISRSDLVLFVLDGSEPLNHEETSLWKEIEGKDRMVICNKKDDPKYMTRGMNGNPNWEVSALTGEGIDELLSLLQKEAERRMQYGNDTLVISNLRHREALKRTGKCLDLAVMGVQEGRSEEFPLMDLHSALRTLGEITGEVTIDDIYNEIFSNFCIGK